MADIRAIFGVEGLPDEAIVASALTQAVGGPEVIDMLFMRKDGCTQAEIARKYDISQQAVSSRLEYAEARVETIKQRAHALRAVMQ